MRGSASVGSALISLSDLESCAQPMVPGSALTLTTPSSCSLPSRAAPPFLPTLYITPPMAPLVTNLSSVRSVTSARWASSS